MSLDRGVRDLTDVLGQGARAAPERWSRAEIALVIGLTLVGAALRLVALDSIPPGLHGDEAWTGLEAQRILRDGPIGPWSPSALGQPSGTMYLTAIFFTFLEPGVLSLRLSIAGFGILTVPLFYAFARTMLGWRPAAIGAVLLVVSYWHLHYSRTALPVTALPWIECLSLYFLARWLKGARLWYLMAAGVAAGLGVYVYKGFPIFAAALFLFWVFLLLARRGHTQVCHHFGRLSEESGVSDSAGPEEASPRVRSPIRTDEGSGAGRSEVGSGELRVVAPDSSPEAQNDIEVAAKNEGIAEAWKRPMWGALLFAVVAFAVALPFLYTLSTSSQEILRYRDLSSPFNLPEFRDVDSLGVKTQFVLKRLYRGVSVYGAERQLDWTDGLGTRGLLDPLTLGLFVIGALAALWAWRDWRSFLLLAGLVTGILATAYLSVPHWGENRRGISALPMVFILAGLGGHILLSYGERLLRRRWLYAGAGLLLAGVAFLNLGYYFGDLTRAETTRIVFVEHLTRATDYVKSLPGEPPYVYLLSANWSYEYETRRFLLPDVAGEDRSAEFGAYNLMRAEARPRALFILMWPYEDDLNELRRLYPNGRYHEERKDGKFLFGAYLIESDA